MKKLIRSLLLASVIANPFVLNGMEPPRKKRRLETNVIPSILGKPGKYFLKVKLIHSLVNNPWCSPKLDAKHLSTLDRKDRADILMGVICNYDYNIKPQEHLNEVIRFLVEKFKFRVNEYESIFKVLPLCMAAIRYIEQPTTNINTVETLLDLRADPFLNYCKKENTSIFENIFNHGISNLEKINIIKVDRCIQLLNLIQKRYPLQTNELLFNFLKNFV